MELPASITINKWDSGNCGRCPTLNTPCLQHQTLVPPAEVKRYTLSGAAGGCTSAPARTGTISFTQTCSKKNWSGCSSPPHHHNHFLSQGSRIESPALQTSTSGRACPLTVPSGPLCAAAAAAAAAAEAASPKKNWASFCLCTSNLLKRNLFLEVNKVRVKQPFPSDGRDDLRQSSWKCMLACQVNGSTTVVDKIHVDGEAGDHRMTDSMISQPHRVRYRSCEYES